MCGIVGLCNLNSTRVTKETLQRMSDSLTYRGPDGDGLWAKGPVGFGHRRLAVIDLSPAGQQPMSDAQETLTVTYNGEIYNFRELRKELESKGHRFRSQTDTEVLLYAYKEWGPACVNRFNGMFAFALYDSSHKTLFLARDRYGIKPLYWFFSGTRLIFASEIKAILLDPVVSRQVCLPALTEYFTFQNVLTDQTLFKGIRLLPSGCTLTLKVAPGSQPQIQRYWDYEFKPNHDLSEKECEDRLYDLFFQAVNRQLVSDVPIGAYLSGGMDSGSIVAVARQTLGRLATFTGGFDLSSASGLELGFDERADSELLANRLKTQHYEMVMHAGDMEHILPTLIRHLEDLRVGQCYPNFYVAQLAGKFVKVVLSGAGGDELFGGYPWRYYTELDSASQTPYEQNYYSFWQRLVPDDEKTKLFRAPLWNEVANYSTFEVFRSIFAHRLPIKTTEDALSTSLYFELKTFLHGLLVVEDKVSMAHSLETRVPFLDNDLVDFALTVPAKHKIKNLGRSMKLDENSLEKKKLIGQKTNEGKTVLRKAMSRLIPPQVTERNKQGFSAPDASWFRGESIDYINRVLRNKKAAIYEFLEPAYVTRILDEHCSGKVNRRLLIWSLLSFETWCQQFLMKPAVLLER